MEDAAIQIAETIQTASIKRSPSPRHDINPSTAASSKEPVKVVRANSDAIDSDETPEYDIRPVRRRATLPPLPDLRFEQSYLKSIEGKDTQGIIWITFRDQLVMPLLQGTLWTLALAGWRHWNKGAEFSGRTIGCKSRAEAITSSSTATESRFR